MQMRPPIQIQSVVKALTDVVLPALDPTNKLAQEQIRLAIGLLGVMDKQIPLQFRFDCDELARLLTLAGDLKALTPGGDTAGAELARQATQAAAVLDRAKADPAEVTDAVRALRAATGAVVTQAYQSNDPARIAPLQKAVLAMSAEQTLRERSWYLPQGWEPPGSGVPAIETLLADVASR